LSHKLRRKDALQAHTTFWAAQQMTYSMPITGLSREQLEKAQKKARQASLGKMGFNQKFPMATVCGPKDRVCLSMVDLTREQGIRAVASFLYHKYDAEDKVGKLMDISVRISQLESGREEYLLLHPELNIPF